MRLIWIAILVAASTAAVAQPAPREKLRKGPLLKIDNCPARDPALTDDELRRRGAEHYTRGATLHVQGDYPGAVEELVASYCTIPYYSILKDIGQAYERNLDYELAIAYLERYIDEIPDDAKRTSQCDVDPKEDKENQIRRVSVLRLLKAHIRVNTQPGGATITLENDHNIVARAQSGDDIAVPGDSYKMRIERPGHESETHPITVAIGKPYTFSYELTPLAGTLAVQVSPGDARIFVDDRFVAFGRFDQKMPAKKYKITVERPGRITINQDIEVLPNQVRRVPIELTPTPQFGRRQLIVFSTFAGGTATGTLLYAFKNTGVAGAGSIGGGAAALVGSYLYLPDDVPLGTSNLTITSTLAASIIGYTGALLFTDEQRIAQPIAGASAILGAGTGYLVGERTRIRPGDAALINSALTWGAAAGGLFALSFAPPRETAAGLVLSGIGLGGISGVIMTRYYDISRTHALLIDLGGLVGILGGLAVESIINPTSNTGELMGEEQAEHLANYALGGMAVGLIGAGILSRNFDAPKFAAQPTINTVTGPGGARTTIYGLSGAW